MTWMIWEYPHDLGNPHIVLLSVTVEISDDIYIYRSMDLIFRYIDQKIKFISITIQSP